LSIQRDTVYIYFLSKLVGTDLRAIGRYIYEKKHSRIREKSEIIAILLLRMIVAAYLTCIFIRCNFLTEGTLASDYASPSPFHFPSIFITARVFSLEMASLRFRQYLWPLLLHPRPECPFFSSFHVLFRRLSCYGRVSLRSRLLKGSFNYLCLPSIIQCTTKDFPENS